MKMREIMNKKNTIWPSLVLAVGLLVVAVYGAVTKWYVPTPPDTVSLSDKPLVTYPDYQNITIPCNVAPLNFMLRDEQVDVIDVRVTDSRGNETAHLSTRGRKAIWSIESWRQLLNSHTADSLHVQVMARADGQWLRYAAFSWYVSPDSIDSYLTYRLIEPGYEVWDKVCIEERCVENFDARLLADGKELGNRCMNCHTHGGNEGQYSFFHLRGEKGGTLLNSNGRLRKLTLRNADMQSGAVYGDFASSGQFAVFSNNIIIPSFHTQANRRLEVYDTTGDLCVADFEHNTLDTFNAPDELMTFPCFSADGTWIYYCASPNPCGDTIPAAAELLNHVKELHYSLWRMPFDAASGQMKPEQREIVYDAQRQGGSVSFPKCSADGKYILFCLSDYGTFPIWHRETSLCLLSSDGKMLNTGINGTYHTWSHNAKWVVFASKREDGQYGRAYFAHIDDLLANQSDSSSHCKSFVLPQADPEHDDMNLRSYNIPDLGKKSAPFSTKEVKMLLENANAEVFK